MPGVPGSADSLPETPHEQLGLGRLSPTAVTIVMAGHGLDGLPYTYMHI